MVAAVDSAGTEAVYGAESGVLAACGKGGFVGGGLVEVGSTEGLGGGVAVGNQGEVDLGDAGVGGKAGSGNAGVKMGVDVDQQVDNLPGPGAGGAEPTVRRSVREMLARAGVHRNLRIADVRPGFSTLTPMGGSSTVHDSSSRCVARAESELDLDLGIMRMLISRIASSIGDSVTLKLNATAARMRAEGVPVIHLGGGEPQGKCPPGAIQATIELVQTGEVRYAPASGLPALKEAIGGYTEQFYGRKVTPANVIASSGAKQSLSVALLAVLNAGDNVLYPRPYWVSYPAMAAMCAAEARVVEPSGAGLQPVLKDFEQRIDDRTRAIMLNTPNNPSGVVYEPELIAGLVKLCEDRGIYLIMDDIYQRLIFDGRKPTSVYDYTDREVDESYVLVVNGVSKQYAMTGFRLGWAVGARELIKAMTNIQAHQTSGSSTLAQHAALGALRGDQSCVDELCRTLERNRDLLMEKLGGIEGLRVIRPGGTFYSLADVTAYDRDATRLAGHLLEKAHVICVPCDDFGLPGYLRVSYCGSESDIVEGVGRMATALSAYQTG